MKRCFLLSFVTAGLFLNAQSIGNSPYAAFGIGDVKYDNTVDISAMGGSSTAYVSDFNNKFNFRNPAANSNLDLTAFTVEGTNENGFYKSGNAKATRHSTYLSNISIAFPLSPKLKFGLDYQPYSSKSYEVFTTSDVGKDVKIANRFAGSGMISTVQGAFSYTISPEFSLGARTNYYFGKLHDLQEVTLSNAEYVNGMETVNTVKAFNFTLGAIYQRKNENDRKFTAGATYTFGTIGKMQSAFTNSTYYYAGEKVNENIISSNTTESNSMLPMEASIGVGYGHEGRWFNTAQVEFRKGEKIDYLGQPFQYKDAYRVSAGGWFLPNYNNFRNYFSRVTYRYGAYYEKGALGITAPNSTTATSINKFALTAGMSLPFASANINRLNGLDFAFEVGKRGTTQNNLINQTFFNVKIGLNFADKWFQKRQYD